MKRLGSLFFGFLSLASLLICLGTVVLCVDSFFGAHRLEFKTYDSATQQPVSVSAEWDNARLTCDDHHAPTSSQPAQSQWSYESEPNHASQWFALDDTPIQQGDSVREWEVCLPIPILTTITAIFPVIGLFARRAARRRKQIGRCPRCNYDLAGTVVVCPQCGNGPPGQKSESPYLRAKMPPRNRLSGDANRRIY